MKFLRKLAPYVLLSISLLLVVVSVCSPKSITYAQESCEETGDVVNLADGTVVTQTLKFEKPLDSIGVRIATYKKVLEKGTLYFEVFREDDLISSMSYQAAELRDNEFIWLNLKETSFDGNLSIRITAKGFIEEKIPAIFLSNKCVCKLNGEVQEQGIAYKTSIQKEVSPIDTVIVAFITFSLGLLLLFPQVKAVVWRRTIAMIGIGGMTTVFIVYLTTYLAFGSFDTTSFLNLLFLNSNNLEEQYFDHLDEKVRTYYQERSDGSAYIKFQNIWLNQVEQEVVSLSFAFSDDALKKRYDMGIFTVNNEDISKICDSYVINEGQNETTIFLRIPFCEQIRIDYGEVSWLEDIREDSNQTVIFKNITVNSKESISYFKNAVQNQFVLATLIIIAFEVGFVLVKRFCITEWLLKIKQELKISREKEFVIWGSLMGVIFLIMLPLFQAPDEGAHLRMLESELGYSGLSESVVDAVPIGYVATQSGEKIDVSNYIEMSSEKVGESVKRTELPSIKLIRHLPQSIGVQLGILLKFTPFWMFMAGRISGLLFYLAIGILTIHLMPYKKAAMLLILTSPMVIQQTASLNYDCMLLAISFLSVAYILYIRERAVHFGWIELSIVTFLIFLISQIKYNYCILGGLIFSVPLEKWEFGIGAIKIKPTKDFLKRNKIWIALSLSAFTFVGILILLRSEIGKILIAVLTGPISSLQLIISTFVQNFGFYFASTFARFGWLDTYAPVYLPAVVVAGILIASIVKYRGHENDNETNMKFGVIDRVLFLAIFLGCGATCFISMIGWTFKILFIQPE